MKSKQLGALLLAITVVLSIFQPEAAAQSLVFRQYNVAQGLANSTVYSIFQDSKGFIWLATESGVNRFNGTNFEHFTVDNGLSDNEVLKIAEDSKGRIWFLTLNGKLSYYLNNTFYSSENDPLLKKVQCQASFVSFLEGKDGSLWFSTNQNLLLEITKANKHRFHRSNTSSFANSYLATTEKQQLVLVNKEQFFIKVNTGFQSYHFAQKPQSAKAIAREKETGVPLIISGNSLLRLSNNHFSLVKTLPYNNVAGSEVGKLLIDRSNEVWISTMGNGVFVGSQHHLKGNIVTDIIEDQERNIWISTIGNGIYMLPFFARDVKNFTSSDGLSSNAVHSVIKHGKKVFIGLRNGELNVITGANVSTTSLRSGQQYNPLKKLVVNNNTGTICFASDNKFGELNSKGELLRLLKEENNNSFAVKDFSISKSSKIAVALASGVYILENHQSDFTFNSAQKITNDEHYLQRAFSVFFDSNEWLWFSNTLGLHLLQDGKVSHLYNSIPALSNRITDILELPDRSIICTSYGSGIFVLKDQKLIKHLTTRSGLVSNICKSGFIDEKNNIWIVTDKGLSKIDPDNYRISNYSTANGLISSEVNDVFIDGDTAYVATNKGLSILTFNHQFVNQAEPRLYINYLKAGNRKLSSTKNIEIPYADNNITVNYIALNYSHPDFLRYSYRLQPSGAWKEIESTTLELAALEPGSYQFQLRAKSLNSNWTEPIVVNFVISAPFWRTWWFISLVLAGFGLVFFQLINGYAKRKRHKEKEELLAKTRIISLEQQALQAMMNPHFVFNVMNSIQYFINTKDNAMANQVLTGFAKLIRKNLENCNKSYVSVREEVDYLNLYLSLEQLRFGDRMRYSLEVDQKLNKDEVMIPTMLLQPYVENAIWHGLMPKDTEGNIWIKILKAGETTLNVEIIDDGIGIEKSKELKQTDHVSRGMKLTSERIKLLSKFTEQPITINIQPVMPEGTHIHLTLPIKNRSLN